MCDTCLFRERPGAPGRWIWCTVREEFLDEPPVGCPYHSDTQMAADSVIRSLRAEITALKGQLEEENGKD